MSKFAKSQGRLILLGIAVLGLIIYFSTKKEAPKHEPKAQPVRVAKAVLADVPRYLPGLGTVTPLQDTVVQSRVDGYLMAIHFKEGQRVEAGDLLVEIDPRPFLVQLEQARGALAKDEALLKNAQLDLARYKKLFAQDAIPAQQLQQQEAQVGQYEGAVQQDKAAIAEAKLQLTYSKVTAPISGVAGLRHMDIGAMVSSNDSSGIVRITQTKPCYVLFTLVDKYLPDVRRSMRKMDEENATLIPEKTKEKDATISHLPTEEIYSSEILKAPGTFPQQKNEDELIPPYGLKTEIWSQDGTEILSSGLLKSIDNQIDSSTGTVKAKAIVPNEDYELFPNQFVNVRLLVETLANVITVPTAAVQRGSDGFFVYRIVDMKASPVQIEAGYSDDKITIVKSGLETGDLVVTDGVDRLREGTSVRF